MRLSAHLKKEPDLGCIQKYRLLELIGQGGMGTVYRALHTQLNWLVAIKVINADRLESPQAKSRFTKEMQLLAQLEHPQIVRASDAGEHDGKPYFVMEYVHGMDLGQLLNRLGPLPYPEACELIKQAASALQFAHDRKILHRDVKPSNLILSSEGRLKLLDLGLAQIIGTDCDRSITDPEFAVGTLAYMAPEVVLGGAIFAGMDRTPKVHQQVTKMGSINGYLWEKNQSLAADYRFFRSNELPFGFVSTTLSVPFMVDVNLETISFSKTKDLIGSFFGLESTLLKNVEDNRQLLSKTQPLNWRFWEWKRDGSSYIAFAEFGGTVKSYSNRATEDLLVLVDRNGQTIRVPVKNLTDESRQAIQQGRRWATYRNTKSLVLADEQKNSNVVVLRDVLNRSYPIELNYQTLPTPDREWVDRLRKVKSLPDDLETIKQEWARFPLYKSN